MAYSNNKNINLEKPKIKCRSLQNNAISVYTVFIAYEIVVVKDFIELLSSFSVLSVT